MALATTIDSDYEKFRHPFTAICAGASMTGKTHFVAKLIHHRDIMITPKIERVIYSYKKYQPIFDTLKNVEFVQGMNFDLNKSVPTLLIIDDQMTESHSKLTDLFTVCAHHDNTSIIFITQVLFYQDKAYRNACQNAMYMILFRSPRSKGQVAHLARQMFTGTRAKGMVEAFEDATSKPYHSLIIDLKPDTPDLVRIRSNCLPDEGKAFGMANLSHCYAI
jgi:hypothetical protein